jgi:hypothetical protein
MPDLVKKNSSGRSGKHKSNGKQAVNQSMNAATNMGIIKNKRGSVKKDDQLQTITLIPGAPNKKLQNIPNFTN